MIVFFYKESKSKKQTFFGEGVGGGGLEYVNFFPQNLNQKQKIRYKIKKNLCCRFFSGGWGGAGN